MNKTCGNCAYMSIVTGHNDINTACVFGVVRKGEFGYLVSGSKPVDIDQVGCEHGEENKTDGIEGCKEE